MRLRMGQLAGEAEELDAGLGRLQKQKEPNPERLLGGSIS